MSLGLYIRWLAMRPMLKKLVEEADMEITHQASNIVLICGGVVLFLIVLSRIKI